LEERNNKWLHIVGKEGHIPIYQDANIYVTELDSGKALNFKLEEHRQLYLKVMEGKVSINGKVFNTGDAAQVADESLEIKAVESVHILLVEMAKDELVQ